MRIRKKKKREINKQQIIVKKERLIQISVSLKTIIYAFGIILFLFIAWYLLQTKSIYIYITKDSNRRESFMYSIIVSMTLLMFMIGCGFEVNMSRKWFKIIYIVIVLSLVYYGYYNYGLGITIYKNYGLLNYNTYESNSKKGLLFFTDNWLFWSYVFIASLIIMTRD